MQFHLVQPRTVGVAARHCQVHVANGGSSCSEDVQTYFQRMTRSPMVLSAASRRVAAREALVPRRCEALLRWRLPEAIGTPLHVARHTQAGFGHLHTYISPRSFIPAETAEVYRV
jgi:hypothetical protein